ncbi:MAG TPA: HAMP domain-containing protein, partial [Kofleriaceae bacterium]
MKVATRITGATAVVVMFASTIYAVFDLRGRSAERRNSLDREARGVATTLRATFEVNASAFHAPSDAQLDEYSRRTGGWRVKVLERKRALDPAPGPNAAEQLKLLQVMTDVPTLCLTSPGACTGIRPGELSQDGGATYFYALPLRAAQSSADPPPVLGMVEISRSAEILSVTSGDLFEATALVGLIVVVTTMVVGLLAGRLVSRPITKLLSGIDDVAKGDLSHVILSERDDEIGQIATRFNDMTFSLRESRGETQRQNEAKLALEQRLGQTEKLATIGQLAAEIAHEVGTPLNVIAGRARSIQKKSRDHEAVEKNAEIVAEQTARITRIIQRLLDFTRRKVGTAGKAEVNVNELSLLTMELLSAQFSSAKVKTRLERAEGLPRVAGDQDRLQQVMINLLLNAVQAMPEGGALGVETALVQRTRPGLEDGAEQSFVS